MDYGSGTTLRKYQWDLIHNPPLVIGLVEDLVEGALAEDKRVLLLKAVLKDFEDELTEWKNKNNIDSVKLSSCFDQNQDQVDMIIEKILMYSDSVNVLVTSIQGNSSNSLLLIDSLSIDLNNADTIKNQFASVDWEKLKDVVCPYLLSEERLELVKIEPILDEEFAAGIDNDQLEIMYSIAATETYPLAHAKFEIYKNDGTLAHLSSSIDISTTGSVQWDGKMNQGVDNDKYIRNDESPFTVKIVASVSEDFTNPFEASATGSTEEEIDEWNDNADMQNWVLCEGCSEADRYEKYKEIKGVYLNKIEIMKSNNPLTYFKENITFDDDENTYTFLSRSIRVHKNFYPVLQDIEGYIKDNYSTAIFDAISNKYQGKIQTFSMRYTNNGSAGSSSISPHGLGLALDIEPKKNSQIIYNERPLVFFLLKKVTGINFNPGTATPSKDNTKTAHDKFLEAFNNTTINALKTDYAEIQTYNETENVFAIGELGQDIINTEMEETKGYLDQLEANGQLSVIQTLSETVSNQIFLTNHKIDELDKVLIAAFNAVIFSTEAKAAINYLDNTYFQGIRSGLEALDTEMQNLQNELAQQTLNYNPANLDTFLDTDFSIDLTKAQVLSNEYNAFITEASQINSGYSNLNTLGTALRNQVNGIGFGNILLEDGFCDLEESLLEAILTEAIQSQNTEWGGQYNSKKDWMHFGINRYHYEDYVY